MSTVPLLSKPFARVWDIFSDGYYWTKPFVHVELQLEDTDGYKLTYGINSGEDDLHEIPDKEFENELYEPPTSLILSTTTADYYAIRRFLLKTKMDREGFDEWHALYFFPIIGRCFRQTSGKWFCSKLLATAIKDHYNVKRLKDRSDPNYDNAKSLRDRLDPNYMTPQRFFNIMYSCGFCALVLPTDVRPSKVY